MRALIIAAALLLSQCAAAHYPVEIVRVIDGDTIVIRGGERVRLLDCDTPEAGESRFITATKFTREYVGRGRLYLLADDGELRRDKYGRILASVWRKGAELTLCESLIKAGLARRWIE